MSMDVLLEDEAAALVEALETFGDEKPTVARSIPKHARVVKKEDNSMKNCLFEKEVRIYSIFQKKIWQCRLYIEVKRSCLFRLRSGKLQIFKTPLFKI